MQKINKTLALCALIFGVSLSASEEVVLKVELDNNPNTQEELCLRLEKSEFGYFPEDEGKFKLRFHQDSKEHTKIFKGRDQQISLSLLRDGSEVQKLTESDGSYAFFNASISDVFNFKFEDGVIRQGFSFEYGMGGKYNTPAVEYYFFIKERDSLVIAYLLPLGNFWEGSTPLDSDGDSLSDCFRGFGLGIRWNPEECEAGAEWTWITEYVSPSLKNDDIEFEDVTLRVAERNPALMSGFIQDVEELREKLQEWHPNEYLILETDLEDFLSKLKTEVKWTRLQQQWERIKKALEQI